MALHDGHGQWIAECRGLSAQLRAEWDTEAALGMALNRLTEQDAGKCLDTGRYGTLVVELRQNVTYGAGVSYWTEPEVEEKVRPSRAGRTGPKGDKRDHREKHTDQPLAGEWGFVLQFLLAQITLCREKPMFHTKSKDLIPL